MVCVAAFASGAVSIFGILLLGVLLGMKHATEADHLAAVATLATRQTTVGETVRQGVAWGIGHTLTLTLIGAVVLFLGKSIPHGLEQGLELAVGVMLIGLGIDVLRRLRKDKIHFHVHAHTDGVRHMHAHAHPHGIRSMHKLSRHRHAHARKLPVRALAIGVMHGMAGSAALILLSLEAVQSFSMGIVYILTFGAGSILGMALLSVAIAIPLRFSTRNLAWLHSGIGVLVGGFSCALGVFMVYRIGFAEGLLLA